MLSTFVNLKQLKYTGDEPGKHLSGFLRPTVKPWNHHQLVTMELSMLPGYSMKQLKKILDFCSSLRHLKISRSNWHVVDVLKNYPNLQEIIVNDRRRAANLRSFNQQATTNYCSEPIDGLRVLSLEAETQDLFGKRVIFTSYDVSQLVSDNSSTLQELL